MKIENHGLQRLSRNQTDATNPLEKNRGSSDAAGSVDHLNGKDKATLSEKAILLSKARKALEEVPEVRQDKVDTLRESIETGNYQVPLEEVVKRAVAQVRMD